MSTIKRSKTDAFDTKQSVNIVKLAEAAFEQVSLDDLTDVVVDNPTDGDILVYNESLMSWENVPQMEFASNLTDLGDITITSVTDGQVLTYDSGTSKWINENPVTGVTTLDGLSDVVITTASTGQVLKYNGTNWVNATDGSTPAGSDTYVQFNDGGSLGADAQFTYNKTTDTLSVPKVNATDGLYTLSASTLGWGSARVYDNSDEMGVILDATDNLGTGFRGFRFDTGMSAPQFNDGTSWRDMYHTQNLPKPIEIGVACSDETTALTTGTAKVTFRVPTAMTLTGVRASLTTAQTSGSTFTVDINVAGTSILSTKLTIDNTEKSSVSAATQAVISDTALDDDDEITVDIDQVGDGTATGLKVWLIGTRG